MPLTDHDASENHVVNAYLNLGNLTQDTCAKPRWLVVSILKNRVVGRDYLHIQVGTCIATYDRAILRDLSFESLLSCAPELWSC